MRKRIVLIEEADAPNILVDGIKFELFCEVQAKDRTFQSLFVKEGGSEVVVEIGKEFAVVGAFSIEESKLRQLFDYIEATTSPDGGLICYESENFPRLLNLAEEAGGRYPTIQSEINPHKRTFLAGLLQHFRPQPSLDKALQNQIQEHMAPVEHIYHSVSELNLEAFQEDPSRHVFPAESLPSGWEWKEWDDGSGHLKSPSGIQYFSYDRAPYANEGGIEYKETSNAYWGVFRGSMSDFMEHAESVVNEKYIDDKAISHNDSGQSSMSDMEDISEQKGSSILLPKENNVPRPSLMLGVHNISAIMREVSDNAWYGRKPTKVSLMAGDNIIDIDGYTYEPGYEYFSATSSISLNGKVLYGVDSRNVGAYCNETYHIGLYKTPEEAISWIKDAIQNQEFILYNGKNASLTEQIQSASSRASEFHPVEHQPVKTPSSER